MNEASPIESLLFPYSTATWLCWIVLMLCAGWFRRWHGIILGELTVATIIFMLHLRWANEAVERHGWQGKSGFDVHFFIGVTISAMVVGMIIFPAGLIGLLAGARKQRRTEIAPPPLPPAGG